MRCGVIVGCEVGGKGDCFGLSLGFGLCGFLRCGFRVLFEDWCESAGGSIGCEVWGHPKP